MEQATQYRNQQNTKHEKDFIVINNIFFTIEKKRYEADV